MSTESTEVLVIGAGLSGLAASRALHGRGVRAILVEREADVGGLCRSIHREGFAFDLTGHVLHLRTDEVRRLVFDLLPDAWERVVRRARIAYGDVLVDYPFQVNLAPLPPPVKKECLLSFFRAQSLGPCDRDTSTFEEWIGKTFGDGIARHFMIPYNRKMWSVDLAEMSAEWTSWAVPVPTLPEVVEGVLGISRKAFGYNPEFLYPKNGGIEALPRALARGMPAPLHDEVAEVDLVDRLAVLRSGRRVRYERLISTIPLPELLRRCRGLSEDAARAARGLRHAGVVVWNVGVAGPCPRDAHWIYYPDPTLPFYRVGFPSNFSAGVAPKGCYSMYVETSVDRPPADLASLRPAVIQGLERAGLLADRSAIRAEAPVVIPYGYVIYDFHRRRVLPSILTELSGQGVLSTGRYGSWEYGSMESAIAQGLRAAEAIP